MGGWRDTEGRTRADRAKQERTAERARFLDTLRYRPLTLLNPILAGTLVLVLVIALLLH